MLVLSWLALVTPIAFLSAPVDGDEARSALDAMISSRWRDTAETGRRYSGLEISGRLSYARPLSDQIRVALGVGTYGSGNDHQSSYINAGPGEASIGLDTAHISSHFGTDDSWSWSVGAGRYHLREWNPALDTALSRDPLEPLAGFHEESSWLWSPLRTTLYGRQEILSSTAAHFARGRNFDNRWRLDGGVLLSWQADTNVTLNLLGQHSHFTSLPLTLRQRSAENGSSFSGLLAAPHLTSRFSTTSFQLALEGHPLEIRSLLRATAAVNWRSPERQVSHFVEGQVGNEWEPGEATLSFAYAAIDPDVFPAGVLDPLYGFANREAFRGSLSYCVLPSLRLFTSFLHAAPQARSDLQKTRAEFIATAEYRWSW